MEESKRMVSLGSFRLGEGPSEGWTDRDGHGGRTDDKIRPVVRGTSLPQTFGRGLAPVRSQEEPKTPQLESGQSRRPGTH